MTNQRIADILARQADAAEQLRQRHIEMEQAAAAAAAKRLETKALWELKSVDLDEALKELNSLMAANGVQLERRSGSTAIDMDLDRTEITFVGDRHSRTLKNLAFNISGNGRVKVRMGTTNHTPAKQYDFLLDQADRSKFMESLLDFVDINTPKSQ